MRISTITNWAYGLTVIMTAVSGVAFLLSAKAAADERTAIERKLTLEEFGETLALESEMRSDEARLYVMRGADRHLAAFRREETEIRARERAIDGLKRLGLVPAESAALHQAERNLDELDALERAGIAKMRAGDRDGAQRLLFGPDHERAQAEVLDPVVRFRELVSARSDAIVRQAQERSDAFSLVAKIMLGLTAALFLAVLYFVLRRRVSLPLARMAGIVTRLANQDYAVEMPVDRRRDEIGDMSKAIEVFRDNGLERDRLDAAQRADRLVKDLILQMMHRLQACDSQDELAEVVTCFAPQIFPGLPGHLYVINDSRTGLARAGTWLDPVQPTTAFPSTACWGLRRGRPHVSNRERSDVACPHIGEIDVASLCVPLTAQGDTVGLLYFEETAANEPAEATRLYLELMAENIGLALANLRLRERLTNLAIKDALTGLLNRRSLDEALNRRARDRKGEGLACLMIDIDHFKRFNDEFGHDAGDAVMQHVAQVMLEVIGAAGSVYRFGGEEFSVLLPNADASSALSLAEQLRIAVASAPLAYRGRILGNVTVSVGVAASPEDSPPNNLINRADAVLLEAKRRGRNQSLRASSLTGTQDNAAA
jgi:diguanylate cyclase (GGDEF)-like protein